MRKIKVMSSYNRALDCLSLAAALGQQGRIKAAANAFQAALREPSLTAAIETINASNQLAARTARASAKRVKAGEDCSDVEVYADAIDLDDDEIDEVLNGDGVDIDADLDESIDDEEEDVIDLDADYDEDDFDPNFEIESSEEDLDGEETEAEFGQLVASMLRRNNR